jgi:predicted RNA methylase
MTSRLAALLEDAPEIDPPDPNEDAEIEDPRWLGYWLVAMARETERAAASATAAPPSSLTRDLTELLEQRPQPDPSLGQLLIDAASVARRATITAAYVARSPGPVVALGDDDGVSLALALLGVPDVHAIDLDPRVLGFLEEAAARRDVSLATHRADFFVDRVPKALVHRAAAVITDPFRSLEDAAPFVAFALALLRRDRASWLLYADHEAWSFDHEAAKKMLRDAGLVERTRKPRLHRYPIGRALFPRLSETAEALGVSLEWLDALVEETSAWSDLFVWERPSDG